MEDKRNTILIADDADINREMLKTIFEEQYQILEAADGEKTIELLEANKSQIAVLFLDLIMPKKSGLDVLDYMKEQGLMKNIPVIMITGEATAESDEKAYEYGVADIIYKPFAPRVVMRRTKNIIELYEKRSYIRQQLKERTSELEESNRKIREGNDFFINTLTSLIELRGVESSEHSRRVKCFTEIIMKNLVKFYPEYNLSKEDVSLIVEASALHDIGKIAVTDNVLLKKKEDLSKEESKAIKMHTIYGCELLENLKQNEDGLYQYCYDICRYHHEKYDGTGYPDGLKGDEIPIWAQAVAVVDCFDYLVSGKVYQVPYAVDEAVRAIMAGECGAFSPKILDCLEVSKSELFQAAELKLSYADDIENQ